MMLIFVHSIYLIIKHFFLNITLKFTRAFTRHQFDRTGTAAMHSKEKQTVGGICVRLLNGQDLTYCNSNQGC